MARNLPFPRRNVVSSITLKITTLQIILLPSTTCTARTDLDPCLLQTYPLPEHDGLNWA